MKKLLLFVSVMLMGVFQIMNAQSEANECGKLVVPAVYDKIKAGNDGLFVVTKGKKEGVVDSNGKIVVPIQYDNVNVHCGGLIVVTNINLFQLKGIALW